jgi:hypothetical protein
VYQTRKIAFDLLAIFRRQSNRRRWGWGWFRGSSKRLRVQKQNRYQQEVQHGDFVSDSLHGSYSFSLITSRRR